MLQSIFCQISNYFDSETLSTWANVATLITTLVVFVWFLLTQWLQRSELLFRDLIGNYGNYVESIFDDSLSTQGGLILKIKSVDSKGFFKGDLYYAELDKRRMIHIHESLHSFYGRLRYRMPIWKFRHPFIFSQNHLYKGKLWIVDRFDFQLEQNSIETYINCQFKVHFFREMGVLRLDFKQMGTWDKKQLPDHLTLYKSHGFDFEPYQTLQKVIFFHYPAAKF